MEGKGHDSGEQSSRQRSPLVDVPAVSSHEASFNSDTAGSASLPATNLMSAPESLESGGSNSSRRRKKGRKDPDLPTRPLSSYNLFFREERVRWLSERETAGSSSPKERGRGGALFRDMGRELGKRWQQLPPNQKRKYDKLADAETDRYRLAMQGYKARQEEKTTATQRKGPPPIGHPQTLSESQTPRAIHNQSGITNSDGGLSMSFRPSTGQTANALGFGIGGGLSQLGCISHGSLGSVHARISLDALLSLQGLSPLQTMYQSVSNQSDMHLANWLATTEMRQVPFDGSFSELRAAAANNGQFGMQDPSIIISARRRMLYSEEVDRLSQALFQPLSNPARRISASALYATSTFPVNGSPIHPSVREGASSFTGVSPRRDQSLLNVPSNDRAPDRLSDTQGGCQITEGGSSPDPCQQGKPGKN